MVKLDVKNMDESGMVMPPSLETHVLAIVIFFVLVGRHNHPQIILHG